MEQYERSAESAVKSGMAFAFTIRCLHGGPTLNGQPTAVTAQRSMRNFTYRIEDDRHPAPQVRRARVRDEHDAVKLAARILCESYHHRGVEIWYGELKVLTLRQDDTRSSRIE